MSERQELTARIAELLESREALACSGRIVEHDLEALRDAEDLDALRVEMGAIPETVVAYLQPGIRDVRAWLLSAPDAPQEPLPLGPAADARIRALERALEAETERADAAVDALRIQEIPERRAHYCYPDDLRPHRLRAGERGGSSTERLYLGSASLRWATRTGRGTVETRRLPGETQERTVAWLTAAEMGDYRQSPDYPNKGA